MLALAVLFSWWMDDWSWFITTGLGGIVTIHVAKGVLRRHGAAT